MITFVEDYTDFTMIYLIGKKSDAFKCFINYVARVEAHSDMKLNVLKCDRGGEYRSNNFIRFCEQKRIKIQYTNAYSPRHNDVAKRINRSIVERARTILNESRLSKDFWGEAVYV